MPLVVPIHPVRGDIAVLSSADGKIVSGLAVSFTVELAAGHWPGQLELVRLDTGAACSAMSLARAERFGLLRDADVVTETSVRTAGSGARVARVRLGRFVARLPDVRDDPFDWPMFFLESWPDSHPTLLGLAGVVADLAIRFDGTPTDDSAFGTATLALRTP